MSFMENMNLLTFVKISKYKSGHKLNRGLKSLDRLRGHPLFMSAHIRAGAVSRTEDASGAEGVFMHRGPLKMHRVPQEAVHSLWSRLFCGPLKMRSM